MAQYNATQGRGYTININSGADAGGAEDDNKNPQQPKINHRNQIRGVHGKQVMNFPLRSLAAFGMGVRFSRQFNQLAGQYTGRKMRAEQVNAGIQVGTMAVASLKFGPLGVAYAAINSGIQIAQHRIENKIQNDKADLKYEWSGNNTRGRSRHGGSGL